MFESYQYSIIAIYLVMFFAYVWNVSLGKSYARAINKFILSTLYLVLAIILFVLNRAFNSIDTILLCALLFTYMGDIILLMDFTIGAGFFTIGNILIFVYELCYLKINQIAFSQYWYFIIVLVVVLAAYLIYAKVSKKYDYKNKLGLTIAYLVIVSLQGSLGFVMYIICSSPAIVCMGFGTFLFMCSDYILTMYHFGKVPHLVTQRFETVLYFIGIILISISLGL